MIRKFLSLLFASLILFNLFGYYFVFKCDQLGVRNEMRGMIRSGSFNNNTEEITIFKPFADKNFSMPDGDEICYQGRLYDVISVKIIGNTIVFRCINDAKEQQLLARYDKYSTLLAGMSLPDRSRNSQAMLYHIIKHALLKCYSFQPPPTSSVVYFFEPSQGLHSLSPQPVFPPPWTV